GKEGLGAAYIAGFGWAKEHNYDAVCEMDADGSHAPEQLHRLLDALRDADGVVGSRYTRGGEIATDWPWHRRLLSRGGNIYVNAIGLGWTLLLMLATSALGGWLLKREGRKAWRAFQAEAQSGRPPGRQATDGVLVVLGGLFMLLPGFVSDAIGLLMIAPPTRV